MANKSAVLACTNSKVEIGIPMEEVELIEELKHVSGASTTFIYGHAITTIYPYIFGMCNQIS